MRRAAMRRPLVAVIGLLGSVSVIAGGGALDLAFPDDAHAQNDAVVSETPATGADQVDPAGDSGATMAIGTPFVPTTPAGASGIPGAAGGGDATMTSLGGADIAVSSTGGSYEVDAPGNRNRKMPKAMPKP